MKKNYLYVLKILSSPFIFFFGYIIFVFTKKTNNLVYQAYVKFYCFSSGLISEFITFLIKITNKKFLKSIDMNLIDLKINNELKKNGYVVLKDLLEPNLVEELFKITKTLKCTNNQLDQNTPKIYFDEKTCTLPTYYYEQNELLKNQAVKSVINYFDNLKISDCYFASKPYLIAVNMWWSTVSDKPDSFAAQKYHFDIDSIKWLKFFVYLTDVGEDGGPHSYVEGTHKPFSKPFKILKRGYKRISDEEIKSYYSSEKIKKILGQKGTIIIGDTSCFHKGVFPQKKSRLIFEVSFANSFFGPLLVNKSKINEFNFNKI